MKHAWVVLAAILLAGGLHAQEFRPPPVAEEEGGIRLGLMGFGVRAGLDFEGEDQLVLGVALDFGDLGSDRVRLRPSGELGLGPGADTYVGSLELLFRFADDPDPAIPYFGLGLGVFGRQRCDRVPDCPDVWANVVLGFEIRYRPSFNWLVEWHGLDALRRHRLYIGLTTRRGG